MREEKIKVLFPEGVETITITKNDYDRLYGQMTYENIILRQEIDRLNNIINELEKILKEEVKELYNEENPVLLDETYIKYATERKMAYMYILDKLKELKEDNK